MKMEINIVILFSRELWKSDLIYWQKDISKTD